jgi:hypothetical protein
VKTTADAAAVAADIAKYQKVEDEGNFKNQYADDWGTSGAPTGWTVIANTDTCEIVASEDGHNNVLHINDNDAATAGVTKSIVFASGNPISVWIKGVDISGTGQVSVFLYEDGTRITGILFRNQRLEYINAANTATSSGVSLTNDVWYHILYYYDSTANTIMIFVNGTLVGTFATQNGSPNITQLVVVNMEGYFDAFYCGDSWLKAWSSFYDGQVADRARWTRYGERGYHSLQFLDFANANAVITCATNGQYAVINYITATETSDINGICALGSSMPKLPPNVKSIELHVMVTADTAHTSNYLYFGRWGNANAYSVYQAPAGAVANYHQTSTGIVELNNGNLYIYVSRGNGTIVGRFYTMGYYL